MSQTQVLIKRIHQTCEDICDIKTKPLKLKVWSHPYDDKSNKYHCKKNIRVTNLQAHNNILGKEEIHDANGVHYKYDVGKNTNDHWEKLTGHKRTK